MHNLFQNGPLSSVTATDVASLTGIPKNSISRAVKKLLAEGLLLSQGDERDARRSFLTLTDKGLKIHAVILPRFRERQERMVSVLSESEWTEFNRLLNKLVERDDEWAVDI